MVIRGILILFQLAHGVISQDFIQYPYRNQMTTNKLKSTNLLFIIFDDLRTELSVYGKKYMITPNFERLAKKAVTFEHAYCQVAVCNPSRDSMLTGLRPDTMGTYGFQSTYKPFLLLPTQLLRSGFKTAGYGKIRHYEGKDHEVWNYEAYDGQWYDYQYKEWISMNSSIMPDKIQNETKFRDYHFATRAIQSLEKLSQQDDPYMIAVGFKMPHLSLHVPFRTFEMYRDVSYIWANKSMEYLSYPPSVPMTEYRCCGDDYFRFMNEEGAKKFQRVEQIENMLKMSPEAHKELMWGYVASITFADEQIGRILDAIDRLQLWDNLTIVLTADHGMHNGEKGTWEKWTMFDESTRVPLMIYHPDSPYKGQMVHNPVELIDLYPTVIDLLVVPYNKSAIYDAKYTKYIRRYQPLEGRSLAPMLLGHNYFGIDSISVSNQSLDAPMTFKTAVVPTTLVKKCIDINQCGYLTNSYAVSQMWKCGKKHVILTTRPRVIPLVGGLRQWGDCDFNDIKTNAEISLMGYSIRTIDYRYSVWMPIDRVTMTPEWNKPIYAEELYDHKKEQLGDDYIYELVNLASTHQYKRVLKYFREKFIKFLQEKVIYRQRDSQHKCSVLNLMEKAFTKSADVNTIDNTNSSASTTSTSSPSATVSSSKSTKKEKMTVLLDSATLRMGDIQKNLRRHQMKIWSNIEHDLDGTNKLIRSLSTYQ